MKNATNSIQSTAMMMGTSPASVYTIMQTGFDKHTVWISLCIMV
jgi:hypothetical protein